MSDNLTAAENAPLRGVPFWIAITGALIIGSAALGWALLDARQPTNDIAPDFTLTSYDGASYQLSALRGKVVVLNFWATWCGPCKGEAPGLVALWSRMKSRGVIFLGIDQDDKREDAQAFLNEFGVAYPNGPDNGIIASYRVQGLPTTIIIDQNGLVAARILAPTDPADLQIRIEAILNSTTQGKT
jgi:cytochrome c biogenesis protein CcmG/thiol:disulfide interchange protein DsbE